MIICEGKRDFGGGKGMENKKKFEFCNTLDRLEPLPLYQGRTFNIFGANKDMDYLYREILLRR